MCISTSVVKAGVILVGIYPTSEQMGMKISRLG